MIPERLRENWDMQNFAQNLYIQQPKWCITATVPLESAFMTFMTSGKNQCWEWKAYVQQHIALS